MRSYVLRWQLEIDMSQGLGAHADSKCQLQPGNQCAGCSRATRVAPVHQVFSAVPERDRRVEVSREWTALRGKCGHLSHATRGLITTATHEKRRGLEEICVTPPSLQPYEKVGPSLCNF